MFLTDILAIGPHADDVDVGCGGILYDNTRQGKIVRILDLSPSQMSTRGTPETRMTEAQAAAQILGATERKNCEFFDTKLANTPHEQGMLVGYIRKWKPETILVPHPSDRHPDHAICHKLVSDACFLSGLSHYSDTENQSPHRPRLLLCYGIWNDENPDIIYGLDTEAFEKKMEAFQTFHSQNPTNDHAFSYFRGKGQVLGFRVRKPYGEALYAPDISLGIDGFSSLLSSYW